jgi:hypothetical protein
MSRQHRAEDEFPEVIFCKRANISPPTGSHADLPKDEVFLLHRSKNVFPNVRLRATQNCWPIAI